ncbi:hypothetical protein DEM27_28610 [Metarhizobium album]|uniref:DnaT DNA-binding domain-containing protein n=1 Tax=Metarhizobium album TaxID=2182425 RepID=A0A2U2DHJ0_9HYPH|nr:hypothetical protein [Rhizobium album]PWE52770.1 hypothetical protein DEM27_28610 [Rhizobium album]
MSRIRTIKPEFFKHEGLFDAEQETGLPIRLAFAGLWTQCDREGRFAWRPRQLKVDIFPYDEVDFSRVLDALATRGFIVKYACQGREFGYIPSWHRHQVVNNREKASELPDPTEIVEVSDASATRGARVEHASHKEGKGKEGEYTPEASSGPSPKKPKTLTYSQAFEDFWKAYPRHPNMSKSDAFKEWGKLADDDHAKCMAAIPGYIAHLKENTWLQAKHADGFLKHRKFDGFCDAGNGNVDPEEQWQKRLSYARQNGRWSSKDWGPAPHLPGCAVPASLLEPSDGSGWAEWVRAA